MTTDLAAALDSPSWDINDSLRQIKHHLARLNQHDAISTGKVCDILGMLPAEQPTPDLDDDPEPVETPAPATPVDRRIARKLAELARDQVAADNYRKLAAFAADLGLEYEAERAMETADEMDCEAEDRRDELIELGYTPDDADDDARQAEHMRGTTLKELHGGSEYRIGE